MKWYPGRGPLAQDGQAVGGRCRAVLRRSFRNRRRCFLLALRREGRGDLRLLHSLGHFLMVVVAKLAVIPVHAAAFRNE